MVKVIRVEKVAVYDGKKPGEARTKFVIRTQSTPQYAPYYTKRDARGRTRKKQMKFHHQYQVVIQLDRLSIDVPFKGRVGAEGRWCARSGCPRHCHTSYTPSARPFPLPAPFGAAARHFFLRQPLEINPVQQFVPPVTLPLLPCLHSHVLLLRYCCLIFAFT
jgi:hypothetical protein